jgi:Rieske Fe-S protein
LGALIARDAMLGQENPWSELFSPDRGTLRGGAVNYLKQNVDYPYYLLKDRLSPVSADVHSLKSGQGRIVQMNGERIACACDAEGTLHAVSAICTHMGCQVQWNNAEETWDCPCHGSRFKPNGEVLAGPAESPLAKVELADPTAKVRSRSKAGTAKTQ